MDIPNFATFMRVTIEMDLMQVINICQMHSCTVGLSCICDVEIPQGVYSLDDLKELGTAKGWCPYFLTRHLLHHASILVCIEKSVILLSFTDRVYHLILKVYNYQYMLDPKVSNLVSRDLEAESIVVFDEAHNIGEYLIIEHEIGLVDCPPQTTCASRLCR